MWTIDIDDLTAEDSRALVAEHLAGMSAQSPAESVHAVGVAKLQEPSVLFFTARDDHGVLGGMAAVQRMGDVDGELKSMRTTAAARGRGLGRALLRHVIAEAVAAGIDTMWLETGSTHHFVAARGLYESEGFEYCEPFADYVLDPESVFMMRRISREHGDTRRPQGA